MNDLSRDDADIELEPGQELWLPQAGSILRLQAGAMRLDQVSSGPSVPVGLALPGDLVGADGLAGEQREHAVTALVPSRLQVITPRTPSQHVELLTLALAQSRRQCRDMVRLRTGQATDRIKCLLLMLTITESEPWGPQALRRCALPSLRDMASMVDAAPETVCRVISSLRRLDVLHDRQPSSVRIDIPALGRFKSVSGMTSSLVTVNRTRLAAAP